MLRTVSKLSFRPLTASFSLCTKLMYVLIHFVPSKARLPCQKTKILICRLVLSQPYTPEIYMQKENALIEGPIVPALLKFAVPFLLASLLQAIYGAADLLMVGQFSNAANMAAVATGSQVMNMLIFLTLGLTMGSTVLIGQYLGAKLYDEVSHTIGASIIIFAVFAIMLTLILTSGAGILTRLLNAPPEAELYTRQYIFICSCGIIFIVGYNVVSAILRGMGDSTSPLIFIAVACVANIILDLILVAGFNLGAAGAAIATIVAQGISLLFAVLFIWKRGMVVDFNRKHINVNTRKVKKILQLGLPIALQNILTSVSFLLITAIINSMGLVAAASIGVGEKISAFTFMAPGSFAAAVAVMAAQNIGAGNEKRAVKCLYAGMVCALCFSIVCFALAQLAPEWLAGLFTRDRAVIQTAALYMRSFSWDYLLVCYVFCANSFFSGCGHPIFAMTQNIIATFAVRVPASYFISTMAGVTLWHIGWAAPAATMLSIVMCAIYMKSGKWRTNTILTEPSDR